MTEWKTIPGYEEFEVSDDGQVRRQRDHKLMKLYINKGGYPTVGMRQKQHRVHRLMALAFLGPSDAPLVRHLDDVRTNNVIGNLAYGNFVDNAMDIVNLGHHHYAKRTHCSRGHEFTEANTAWSLSANGRPRRSCRLCRGIQSAARGIPPRVRSDSCPYGHLYPEPKPGDRKRCPDCNRFRQQARHRGITYAEYMEALNV